MKAGSIFLEVLPEFLLPFTQAFLTLTADDLVVYQCEDDDED